MNGRREFTITKLRLDDDGVWRARVTVDGAGVDVDRFFGSWRIPPDPKHEQPERQIRTYIVLELAAKVRAIENARGPRKKYEQQIKTPEPGDSITIKQTDEESTKQTMCEDGTWTEPTPVETPRVLLG